MACHGSGSQMGSKRTAALILLLVVVLLGCHALSAHGKRFIHELDGGGGGGYGQAVGGIKIRPLEGRCKRSRCVSENDMNIDTYTTCFCCLSTPELPCYVTEAPCVKVCRPQVLPPGFAPPGPPPAL